MNFQTLNKQRKFILIAALIGIISLFLPWISISLFGYSQNMNGFRSYGIAVFIGFAAAAIISFLGDQTKSLDKNMWLAALVAGATSLLFTFVFLINISGVAGQGMGLVDAGYGMGIWLGLAASAGVLGSAWMFKDPADNLKDSFESIKKNIASSTPAPSNLDEKKTTASSNKIAELEKLIALKESGSLTDEEFQQLKSKLL